MIFVSANLKDLIQIIKSILKEFEVYITDYNLISKKILSCIDYKIEFLCKDEIKIKINNYIFK